MKHFRSVRIEKDETNDRLVRAIAVTYETIDTYRTKFAKGVFSESLQKKLPKLTWSHQWSEPIGRVIEFRDNVATKDGFMGLEILGEFDDPEAVPRAKQAMSQIRSGTLEEVSVGFSLSSDEDTEESEGILTFLRATLDEVAIVLKGAVTGATITGLRNDKTLISDDDVLRIISSLEPQIRQGTSRLAVMEYAINEIRACAVDSKGIEKGAAVEGIKEAIRPDVAENERKINTDSEKVNDELLALVDEIIGHN